jgi:hypothetical protein
VSLGAQAEPVESFAALLINAGLLALQGDPDLEVRRQATAAAEWLRGLVTRAESGPA